jgi:hypothetical protein
MSPASVLTVRVFGSGDGNINGSLPRDNENNLPSLSIIGDILISV